MRTYLLPLVALTTLVSHADAASSTWTSTVNNSLWGTASNWNLSTIADGADSTADFSAVNLASDLTVRLNSSRTIGSLIFGNTNPTPANNWTLDNNGNAANILTLAGAAPGITVNNLGSGKSATISAVITGTAAWTKSGSGTLTLSGNNTLTGDITINEGTVIANVNRDVVANPTYGALGSGTASRNITINKGATLLLGQKNIFGSGSNNNINTVLVIDGGTVNYSGTATMPQNLGAVTLKNGAILNSINGGNWNNYQAYAFTKTVTVTGTAGSFITSSGTITPQDNLEGAITFDVGATGDSGPDLTISASLANRSYDSAAGSLIKAGAGRLLLSASNSYTGGTTLAGGVLSLGHANAVGTSGTLTFSGGTLQYTAANMSDNSARFSNAANQSYKVDTNGQNVTLASNLSSSGGTFTKLGSGTLTLSGSNTFTGDVAINAGALVVGGPGDSSNPTGSALGSLGSSRTVTVNPGASLLFNRANVFGNAGSSAFNVALVVDAGTVSWNNNATTMQQTLGLVTLKNGAVLNSGNGGNPTYPGYAFNNTITATGSTGSFITTTGTTDAWNTLQGTITFNVDPTLDATPGLTVSAPLANRSPSGVGGLVKTGSGRMVLAANNTYSGTTAVNAGKLVVSGTLSNTTAVTVAAGAELAVNGEIRTATPVTVDGALSGTGVLGGVSVRNGGQVAPGNSGIGKLGLTTLTGTTGATLSLDLGKATLGLAPVGGSDYDQLTATGVTLNNITLTLNSTAGTNAQVGDKFFLIINSGAGSVTGTFAGRAQDSTFFLNGLEYRISYNADWTGTYGTSLMTGGNDVALLVIPEPNSWAMIVGGFGMLVSFQRLRRNRVGTR